MKTPEALHLNPEDLPPYTYLSAFDLLEEMRAQTQATYAQEAETFAELEWNKESISSFWYGVFEPLREVVELFSNEENLKEKYSVLSLGSGNILEAVLLVLLAQKVSVRATDSSEEMLNEGIKRLTYDYLQIVINFLINKTFTDNIWIEKVVILAGRAEKADLIGLTKIIRKRALHFLRKRLKIIQADMTDLTHGRDLKKNKKVDLTATKYDLVLAIASVPHIYKSQLTPLIHNVIDTLNPGATFFFNVRLDEDQNNLKGRVFMDTVLNNRPRYFTTYVLNEIAEYMYQLSDISLNDIPQAQSVPSSDGKWYIRITTTKNVEIEVEFTRITDHPDPLKPRFLGIKIKRLKT